MKYLAKPDQTYSEHIESTFENFKHLVSQQKPLIQNICARNLISQERFIQSALLAVVTHDLGKLTDGFQAMISAKTEEERREAIFTKNYRHEVASFPFAVYWGKMLSDKYGALFDKYIPLEALAVAGHHKAVSRSLMAFERERSEPHRLIWCRDGIPEGLKLAQELFRRSGWELPDIPAKDMETLLNADPFSQALSLLIRNIHLVVEESEPVKEVFFLMKSLLMGADWGASSGRSRVQMVFPVCLGSEEVVSYIKRKVKKEKREFVGLRKLQEECGGVGTNAIVLSPTGSGKTEGALLWALNQLQSGASSKILYLLPTMVTTTALYHRIKDFFGEHDIEVGLTHSLASVLREDTATWEQSLFEKHFVYPVTVATVDQLLTILFHRGRWALKTLAAVNAAIVFDEIHSYDPYTLGLVSASIQQFGELGARFLLMSATMPRSLVGYFSDLLDQYGGTTVLEDRELLDSIRNKYLVRDALLEDCLDDVQKYLDEGKRVLVVVNSVKQAQEIATSLRHLSPVCYHSKFILEDRQRIEDRIQNDPSVSLVIATQVVEVALDIDFDVLLTECAPPDAIIQRAGRVNRRWFQEYGLVVVYKPGPYASLLYEDGSLEALHGIRLLEKTFETFTARQGLLTERCLLDIVEEVYRDEAFFEKQSYHFAATMVNRIQREQFGVLDYQPPVRSQDDAETRLQRYIQVSVVPTCFKYSVGDPFSTETLRHKMKMPLWFAERFGYEENGIRFCHMLYDSFIGGRGFDEP